MSDAKKHSNVGRVLTVRVTVTDHEASKWIWSSGSEGTEHHGVKVSGISDGDMFDEVRKLEEEVESLREN